jgi:cytochrome P450
MIEIRRIADGDPFEFDVVVRQGKGTTLHHVTLSRELYERLIAGMHTPERLIEAAFRFLLDREPKEAILRRFDVSVIARFFPEFERDLPRYLAK